MSGLSTCAAEARPLPFPAPASHLECAPNVYQVLTGRVATVLRLAGQNAPRALAREDARGGARAQPRAPRRHDHPRLTSP